MALTPDMIQDIRRSWALVAREADAAMDVFYENLFRIAPRVKPLFAGADLPAQRRKLAAALGLVVRSADALPTLVPTLRELGARHAAYGVEPGDYDAVGRAFLLALEQGLGPDFNDATRTAWATAYGMVADVMLDGAASAAPRRASA